MAGKVKSATTDEELFDEARKRLWDELVLMHDCWAQYRYLFQPEERVRMLNACARWFFDLTRRLLIREVILGISRATDPVTTRGFDNLVIRTLLLDPRLEMLGEVRSRLELAIEEAEEAARPIRKHRDKYIAHLDRHTAAGTASDPLPKLPADQITKTLEALGVAYNVHNSGVYQAHASMELYPLGGAGALVGILESSERWRRWQELNPERKRQRSNVADESAGDQIG